jgi:hypothetical protein
MVRKQNARSAFFGIYSVFRVAFLHRTAASIQVVGVITTDRRRLETRSSSGVTGLLYVLSLFSSLEDLIRSRQHIERNCQPDLLGGFEINYELELCSYFIYYRALFLLKPMYSRCLWVPCSKVTSPLFLQAQCHSWSYPIFLPRLATRLYRVL